MKKTPRAKKGNRGMSKSKETTTEPQKTLVLRTCNADMTSHNGFKWPRQGPVECPDWDPAPKCGNGLHGLPWGQGDWSLLSSNDDAVWQVVEVDAAEIVNIDNAKCKFPRGNVVFSGSRVEATIRVLCGAEAMGQAMRDAQAWGEKSGDSSTAASSGDSSTAASSGDYSTAASSGDYSTAASSGDYSTAASSGYSSKAASSGYSSTAASSGDYSTAASSGYYSKAASSGYSSTAASSGYSSKAASSGYSSKAASSGDSSTAASSGDYSTAASSGYSSKAASSGDSSKAASSGYSSKAASSGDSSKAACEGQSGIAASIGTGGMAKAGPLGLVIVTYWSESDKRHRACVGNVGEDGVKADVWYRVKDGKLVEAAP